MFRFEDPIYLYALVLIPVLALIRWWMVIRQRKQLRRFGDIELVRQLMPDVSRFRPLVKFCLLLTALALLIVMLARPQMGTKITHEKRTGIETIIALDISNSMLAEDVAPSRLDRAKMMVENLVDHFTNDKIGLIVFAGDAFVQLPITSDFVSAKMFLSSIEPSMIETQGTDIAAAVNMATHSFTQEEGVGKAGMRVYVLGIGSTKGAPIPIPGTGDYMKDNTGETVMSALNEEMCKQVAEAGGGAYIHVENNSHAQEQLNTELDKLAKKEISSTIYSDYDEQFQAVGILVLILLIAEICLLEIKNPHLKNLHLFGRKKVVTIFLLLMALSVQAQSDRDYISLGNKQYRAGKYADAEVNYRKAMEKNARNPQAYYNLGNALLAQKKDSAAIEQYQAAAKIETNARRKAWTYHNIGVICQGHQMYGEAIDAYKEALRNNPYDDETRYNLEVCKHQQKKQQQNQQNQQQQNKNQKDNKDKNKDQDKKDQDKKDDQQKQDKQQQQQKPQMSKENAEQLLNAAMQEEKNTQQRIKKAQHQKQSRKLQKNW